MSLTPVQVAEKVGPLVAAKSERVSDTHTVEAFNKAINNFKQTHDGNLLAFLAKFDLQGVKTKEARTALQFFDRIERQETPVSVSAPRNTL